MKKKGMDGRNEDKIQINTRHPMNKFISVTSIPAFILNSGRVGHRQTHSTQISSHIHFLYKKNIRELFYESFQKMFKDIPTQCNLNVYQMRNVHLLNTAIDIREEIVTTKKRCACSRSQTDGSTSCNIL